MSDIGHSDFKFDPDKIRRDTTWRLLQYIIASVMVTIAVFVAGIVLFPATTDLRDAGESVDWSLLEGIVGLVAVSLVIGGGVFLFLEYINNEIQQVRDSAQASFNIYSQIYERITNPEDTASRRWLLENLPRPAKNQTKEEFEKWLEDIRAKLAECPDGWEDDLPPGKMHLRRTLNTLDYIGFVANHYWNMDNELIVWISSPVAKVWERIGPSVEREAKLRNEPDYFEFARQLGDRCLDWRQKHYPNWNIIDDAT